MIKTDRQQWVGFNKLKRDIRLSNQGRPLYNDNI